MTVVLVGFEVASTLFASGGLAVSITNTNQSHCIYFDCTPWSDYIDEAEKLFIGGLCHFELQTIWNMSTAPIQNYKLYLEAMGMFDWIVEGWNSEGLTIRQCHAKALELLISEEMNGKYLMSSNLEFVVPRHVVLLFHHFLQNITDLEVDWSCFRRGFGWYSHLVPVLSNEDGSGFNLDLFLRILPNIRSVHIYNEGRTKKPSLPLDSSLNMKLVSAVKYINESDGRCRTIALVNPIGDLNAFIRENDAEYRNEGWVLTKKSFESVFHLEYDSHPNTLSVQKV